METYILYQLIGGAIQIDRSLAHTYLATNYSTSPASTNPQPWLQSPGWGLELMQRNGNH